MEADEAASAVHAMASGAWSDAQIAGFLIALQAKGPDGNELAGMARAMRELCRPLNTEGMRLLDTCGTGGGKPTWNLSTAAAIVSTACGVKVAKHGNRAVTSSCGSADVLEALGVRIAMEPEQALHVLERVGVVFLFAPNFHPAMGRVGPVRRDLGVRTVFNLLGPLANPAGVNRQVLGVFDPAIAPVMADALVQLGIEEGWVVCSEDGLDEISPCGLTQVFRATSSGVDTFSLDPAVMGLEPVSESALLPGATVQDNAALLRLAISEVESPQAKALLPCAAVSVHLGLDVPLSDAANMAAEAIRSGRASEVLHRWVEVSNLS